MKKSLLYLLVPILISSCSVILTIPESKRQNDFNLGVEWVYDSLGMNKEFVHSIDSAIELSIAEFNKDESHSYKLHKKNSFDSAYITLIFDKSSLASNTSIVAGYVLSSLGIISCPILTLASSQGKTLIAFWYFPRDYIDYRARLSPYLAPVTEELNTSFVRSRFDKPFDKNEDFKKTISTPVDQNIYVLRNACFTKRSNRIPFITTKFKESVMRLFCQLEDTRYNP